MKISQNEPDPESLELFRGIHESTAFTKEAAHKAFVTDLKKSMPEDFLLVPGPAPSK